MTLLGEGSHPTAAHCLELAGQAGIKTPQARAIIAEVNDAISRWPEFAEVAGCSGPAKAHVTAQIVAL